MYAWEKEIVQVFGTCSGIAGLLCLFTIANREGGIGGLNNSQR
jgi:hypothetical protein